LIHVLTLSWNGFDKLETLHPGLIKNLKITGQDYIWHIRSNGCKDGTIEKISNWDNKNIVSYAIEHNRDNFAQGMNYLTEQAKSNKEDILLFMNNDVKFIDDNSLFNMLDLLNKNAQISMVGARLLYNNTNKLQHAGVIFGAKYNHMPYHFRHTEESDVNAEKNRYFQAVTAAVCMVKSKDFQEVGGFNPAYFWSFEDIDLCLRIGRLDKKIAYCGKTFICHEESASLKKNPINKMFLTHNVLEFQRNFWENGHNKKQKDGGYEDDHSSYLNVPDHNVII
jgi:GT2 family glycosyltransferase